MAQDDDAVRLSSGRWFLSPAAEAHWRTWGDEVVAYHEATASTHLLEGNLATVFLALEAAGPRGTDEAGLWRDLEGVEPTADQRLQLRDILDSLHRSGLAECRAS